MKIGDYVRFYKANDEPAWFARVVGVRTLLHNRSMLNVVRSDGGAVTIAKARCVGATERDFLKQQAEIALLGGRHDAFREG